MAIIAKAGSKAFEPCPAGPQQAVCVDVVDLGMLQSKYANEDGTPKMQHKIEIVWQSADTMPDGRPYMVKERFTLSLHEKANLRKVLESWRGRPFTDDELDGFDVENVIGVNALINVAHAAGSRGGTFANVVSVMPLMKGQAKIAAQGYVRVKDRQAVEEAFPDGEPTTPSADDIPF